MHALSKVHSIRSICQRRLTFDFKSNFTGVWFLFSPHFPVCFQPTNQLTNQPTILCVNSIQMKMKRKSIQTFVGSFNTSVEWLLCFLTSRKFISLWIWLIWLLINFNEYWLLRLEVGRRPNRHSHQTAVRLDLNFGCQHFSFDLWPI